jgi:6-pyruvoyltetrahydropterin/6-carboxytetrahydropterin synthase
VLLDAGERVQALAGNPTAEAIARMIYDYVAGKGYPVCEVTVWETETSRASYSRER